MTEHTDEAVAIEGYGFEAGQRVRLIEMPDDPDPVLPGTEGTIRRVVNLTRYVQLWMEWDNGRTISCVIPPDRLEVI